MVKNTFKWPFNGRETASIVFTVSSWSSWYLLCLSRVAGGERESLQKSCLQCELNGVIESWYEFVDYSLRVSSPWFHIQASNYSLVSIRSLSTDTTKHVSRKNRLNRRNVGKVKGEVIRQLRLAEDAELSGAIFIILSHDDYDSGGRQTPSTSEVAFLTVHCADGIQRKGTSRPPCTANRGGPCLAVILLTLIWNSNALGILCLTVSNYVKLKSGSLVEIRWLWKSPWCTYLTLLQCTWASIDRPVVTYVLVRVYTESIKTSACCLLRTYL